MAAVLVTSTVGSGYADPESGAQARLAGALAQPSLHSPIDATNFQIVVESTGSDQTAAARIGAQLGEYLFDLKMSGPVSGSGDTHLADLDGLRSSTVLDVGLGWIHWDPKADPVAQEAVATEYKKTLSPEAARSFETTYLSFPQGSEYRRRFDRAVDWGTPFLVKLRYREGRKKYSFVDPTSLEGQSETHRNYSIPGAVGVLTGPLGLVALAYRYEEVFSAGEETQLCEPFGSSGALLCDTVRLGRPGQSHANIVQGEIRRFFSERLGVNPRASYNIDDEILGLELPVYFLRDVDRGLNGGVNVGWRSDDHELLFSVFVGEALSLVP